MIANCADDSLTANVLMLQKAKELILHDRLGSGSDERRVLKPCQIKAFLGKQFIFGHMKIFLQNVFGNDKAEGGIQIIDSFQSGIDNVVIEAKSQIKISVKHLITDPSGIINDDVDVDAGVSFVECFKNIWAERPPMSRGHAYGKAASLR